jgi:hypothetical protein
MQDELCCKVEQTMNLFLHGLISKFHSFKYVDSGPIETQYATEEQVLYACQKNNFGTF